MTTPDLAQVKSKALEVLSQVQAIKEAGEGTISMQHLLSLLDSSPDPELRGQVAARGPIEAQIGEDGSGAFRNVGPEFSAPLGPGTVTVPREVAGRITCVDSSVVLDFHADKTLIGEALWVQMPLERIEISDHHVAVRLPGGIFDQEYKF